MSALLIDIGNSRLKAATWDGETLHLLPPVPHRGDISGALMPLAGLRPTSLHIAHVMGAATEPVLTHVAQTEWQLHPRFARAEVQRDGLSNAYAEPLRLGVDRWLAMLAAWKQHRRAFIVVDAGTALTADVVNAQGQHLGGFIAAGLLTSQRAVLGATRFDTRDAKAAYNDGLGRDTEACVRQGALLSCIGAIDRAATLAGPQALRLITGGDAALLQSHLAGEWQRVEGLVLEGLLAQIASRN